MEHPLIGNLDSCTVDELTTKINELNKKLGIAMRMGNADLCNQIRMAIENHQNKLRDKYTEMTKKGNNGDDFDKIIDIS